MIPIHDDALLNNILHLQHLQISQNKLALSTGTALHDASQDTGDGRRTPWAPSGLASSPSPRFLSSSTIFLPVTRTSHLSKRGTLNAESGYCRESSVHIL